MVTLTTLPPEITRMHPRFCYDRLVITETGMHRSVFLLGPEWRGCVDTAPCGSPGTWALWLPGTWPLWSLCVWGLGVSCSTAPLGSLCVGVDTAPVTPGVWAHVVPVCRGTGGLAVPPSCVPRGTPRPPDTRGPKKIGGFFSAPSYEATHALRVSHPGSSFAAGHSQEGPPWRSADQTYTIPLRTNVRTDATARAREHHPS